MRVTTSRHRGDRERGGDPIPGCIHLEVYCGVMSRTNIDIDDELVAAAQRMYRLKSKRSAVELALRRLVGEPLGRDEALALQGSGVDFSNDEIEAFSDADTDRPTRR